MAAPTVEPPKPFKIKPKVLWGFSLLLLLVLATVLVTYWGVLQLAETRRSLASPGRKLVLLNSTLTLIYQSESSIRAYTLTQDEKLLKHYLNSLSGINNNIDTLSKLVSNDSIQGSRVAQIRQLLTRKKLVLAELIALKQSDWSSEFYNQALKEIERMENDSVLRDAVIVKTTTTKTSKRDTVVKRPPQKAPGFFGRLKGWFTGSAGGDTTITLLQVEERIKIDTLRHSWVPTDSLLRNVLEILTQIRLRQNETITKMSTKEMELLKTDLRLIDQIRAIVSLLETEELNDNINRTENARIVVGKSTILIVSLGALALFTSVLFVMLILRAVSRSDFYRQQLVEANRYADKLLLAKEEFLSNMSHEIRSPLTSVIGFAGLLNKTPLNDEQKGYIESIAISSEHLLDIVNDLLDLSKIEGGFITLEQAPFLPFRVAKETINLFAAKANERGLFIDLMGENEAGRVVVLGDAYRLKQMLINLVGNAIKFTEKGGVTLTVQSTLQKNGSMQLTFEVADTGIGIEPTKLGHLFERFVQADKGITRKYGGTGLGLAIVKNLAALHGGSITASSIPGEGSKFTLTISYPVTTLEPENLTPLTVSPASLPNELKILVVDDDPLICELLQRMLAYLGTSAAVANSPAEALEILQESSFDLMLTDIHMPIMSGFDFIKEVKKLNLANQPLSIAITADHVGDDTELYKQAGFSGVITKPFDEHSLYNAIAGAAGLNTIQPPKKKLAEAPNSFDLSDIERFCENDALAFAKVIESIVSGTEKGLDQLESAIENKDWDGFFAAGHRLRSTFGQIKANELLHTLIQADQAAKMHDINLAAELTGKLKSQFVPIATTLSDFYINKA